MNRRLVLWSAWDLLLEPLISGFALAAIVRGGPQVVHLGLESVAYQLFIDTRIQ